MEQKQTAVEYIENAIQKYMAYYEGHYKAELFTIIELNEAVKQAKEMEKQQIIEAYDQMRCVGNFENGEQYYNEEYGK